LQEVTGQRDGGQEADEPERDGDVEVQGEPGSDGEYGNEAQRQDREQVEGEDAVRQCWPPQQANQGEGEPRGQQSQSGDRRQLEKRAAAHRKISATLRSKPSAIPRTTASRSRMSRVWT